MSDVQLHLFRFGIDQLKKSAAMSECGKRMPRDAFARGSIETNCPACRAVADRTLASLRNVVDEARAKKNPELADIVKAVSEFEARRYRNIIRRSAA